MSETTDLEKWTRKITREEFTLEWSQSKVFLVLYTSHSAKGHSIICNYDSHWIFQ